MELESQDIINCQVQVILQDVCSNGDPEVCLQFQVKVTCNVIDEEERDVIVGEPMERPKCYMHERDVEITFEELVSSEHLKYYVWEFVHTKHLFSHSNADILYHYIIERLNDECFEAVDVAKIDIIVEIDVGMDISDVTSVFEEDNIESNNDGFEEETVVHIQNESSTQSRVTDVSSDDDDDDIESNYNGFEEENVAHIQSESGASRASIDALEIYNVKKDELIEDICTICRDEFLVGEEIKKMPCYHIYHTNCLLTWLEKSHVCPICRFKLPIDEKQHIEEPVDIMDSESEST
ncbi:E3 ubiquitin-protein ligase ring1-like [Thalictrum thalictroides]|uniref:E3 ubiquitin-protein ligase ring1-like n=1 Tax=Thalictrum thalictroides TaxID=46969 RepID=A0A7J6VBA8_THATH|nr:E3 ubiquitin-protein ligase ring1-like [Thalictrum thalictroides]